MQSKHASLSAGAMATIDLVALATALAKYDYRSLGPEKSLDPEMLKTGRRSWNEWQHNNDKRQNEIEESKTGWIHVTCLDCPMDNPDAPQGL